MSYWIYLLNDSGKSVAVEPHTEGGTYVLGGCDEAEINVTYNYAKHFAFRSLHGRTGKETLSELNEGVASLGTQTEDDYWASTPGNVGHTLAILERWARANPSAKWCVS